AAVFAFVLLLPRPPLSSLFPYTTLFRSLLLRFMRCLRFLFLWCGLRGRFGRLSRLGRWREACPPDARSHGWCSHGWCRSRWCSSRWGAGCCMATGTAITGLVLSRPLTGLVVRRPVLGGGLLRRALLCRCG